MKRQFIPDKEIILDKSTDLLNTSIYANNLANMIQQAPQGQVFNIGLFGSWGSGKSSIIATAKDKLTSHKGSKVKFITYDAWKYANDSFRRMFLFEVQKELGFKRTPLMEKFYQNNNQEIDVKNKIAPLKILLTFAAIITVILIVSFINVTTEVRISVYSILSIIGILIGILTGCFNQLKVAISKPFLFAPEQFEQCFQEMMEEALKPNILQQVFQFITRGSNNIAFKRVVIVIDNIDRCNSEQAYNLLTDIKTFLCDEPFNIVFVIPVDDEALRKHILNSTNSSNSDECTRDKEEFLRKFFNVTLRIKPHQPTEMYEFAQKLNDKYALGFKNATINIASKEYAKNPRRVIQLFNNLSAELDNYDTEFATLYETLICKILIIREEYNAYYQELLKDYTLLEQNELSDKFKENEELKRLLADTKSYTSNYNSSVLSRILTNSESQFTDMPTKIKEMVDAHNISAATEELPSWIQENTSNTERFIGYCLFNIDKAIKRQLWDSEFKADCEFLAKINSVVNFSYENNIRIAERLEPHILELLPTFSVPSEIVAYANQLQNQGIHFLIENIVTYLINNKEETNEQWTKYLQSCINQCDEQILSQVGDLFTNEYKKENYNITTLNNKQIKALVKDSLILYAVDKWSSVSLDNKYITDFIFIAQNTSINDSISTKIYDKIVTLLGDLRGVSKEDLLNKMLVINKITENLIFHKKPSESTQKLYKLITGQRGIPNPSRPNYPQYDSHVRLVDECNSIDEIDILTRFIVTTYKVVLGRINITAELDTLMSKNSEVTLNEILWLNETWKFSLYPLASHLIKYNTYDNDQLMDIYKSHFVAQCDDGSFILTEEELRQKLDNMLQYAIKNQSNKMFNWLNEISGKNNRIKTMLIPIISARPIGEIQSLPKELMDLAVNSVDQNNIGSYKKFSDFLICLATEGTMPQKQMLANLLVQMLDDNSDHTKVTSIIKAYKNLSKTYCSHLVTKLQCIIEDKKNTTSIETYNEAIEHLLALHKSTTKKKKQKTT